MAKKSKDDEEPCIARMRSKKFLRHIHSCVGNHDGIYHFCGECREWWGKASYKDA